MIEKINQFLSNYYSLFPEERGLFSVLVGQLQAQEDLIGRKNFNGHVTASGLLILDNRQVLAIFHQALQKYLQPGGHIESTDQHLAETAGREIREEAGIEDIKLSDWCQINQCPILIDTHLIPANAKKQEDEHYHHDFMFVFQTNNSRIMIDDNEVSGFQWLAISEARKQESNIARALNKMATLGLIK